MRGFSVLETVIALAVFALAIVAVTLLALGAPGALDATRSHREAQAIAEAALSRELARGGAGFDLVEDADEEHAPGYRSEVRVTRLQDGALKLVRSEASWTDAAGRGRSVALASVAADHVRARPDGCGPFVVGDWTRPRAEPVNGPLGFPPVSAVAATRRWLTVAAPAAAKPDDPVLFAFSLDNGAVSSSSAYDSVASTSVGYASVALARDVVYAVSAEASCPQDAPACARLDALSLTGPAIALLGSLPIEPASVVRYADGFVYVGLRGLESGPEFVVVDVRDPASPSRLAFAEIGDKVNDIAIGNGVAYLAVATNARADDRSLLAFDLSALGDGMLPSMRAWHAGGGVPQRLALGERLLVGRSLLNNSRELLALKRDDIRASEGSFELESGVYGLASYGDMVAALLRDALEIRDASDLGSPGVRVPLGSGHSAVALACAGNRMYAASNAGGRGYVTMLSGS